MTSIGLAELGMDQLAGSPAAPGNVADIDG